MCSVAAGVRTGSRSAFPGRFRERCYPSLDGLSLSGSLRSAANEPGRARLAGARGEAQGRGPDAARAQERGERGKGRRRRRRKTFLSLSTNAHDASLLRGRLRDGRVVWMCVVRVRRSGGLVPIVVVVCACVRGRSHAAPSSFRIALGVSMKTYSFGPPPNVLRPSQSPTIDHEHARNAVPHRASLERAPDKHKRRARTRANTHISPPWPPPHPLLSVPVHAGLWSRARLSRQCSFICVQDERSIRRPTAP